MSTSQVQLKLSLSEQLSDLLKSRAQRLGLPVTQLVKYMVVKELEKEEFPIFAASDELEKISEKALKEIDNSVSIDDIDEFFRNL